jgi:hypothetical protein
MTKTEEQKPIYKSRSAWLVLAFITPAIYFFALAEFYAPGRLIRNPEGKIRHFWNVAEVADQIRQQGGKPVLALVPFQYVYQLSEGDSADVEFLADNGELAIYAVSLKGGEITGSQK